MDKLNKLEQPFFLADYIYIYIYITTRNQVFFQIFNSHNLEKN